MSLSASSAPISVDLEKFFIDECNLSPVDAASAAISLSYNGYTLAALRGGVRNNMKDYLQNAFTLSNVKPNALVG